MKLNTNIPVSVIIAEDEEIIRNNIAKKIEKISADFSVTGRASSGKEALELMQKEHFDILITDIEMPGINGLELINQVKARYPDMKIVVLSGYSNFEYVRTALRHGVSDYLLKPVSFSALSEIFQNLAGQINQEKHEQNREIISLALNGSLPDNLPPFLFPELNILLVQITLGNPPCPYSAPPAKDCDALWKTLDLSTYRSHIPQAAHLWFVDEVYPLQKFLLIGMEEFICTADYFSVSLQNYIQESFPTLPFTVLIYPEPIPYTKLWECARLLRSYTPKTCVPFQQQAIIFTPPDNPEPFLSVHKNNIHALYALPSEKNILQFVQTKAELYLTQNKPAHMLYELLYEGLQAVSLLICPKSGLSQSTTAFLFDDFYLMEHPDDCITAFISAINTLKQSSQSVITSDSLCTRLHQYIQKNYNQKLSLSDLAAEFGYTDSYINRIFKKEYGLSPLQYMNKLKLEHAMELLSTSPELDIKSIATLCGYEDARYFSRVFKNETGMTPSAWSKTRKN